MNTRTIKKVVEAKARKKRKLTKKLDKARKKAAGLMENEDLGSREKGREIARLYKRAESVQKKEVCIRLKYSRNRIYMTLFCPKRKLSYMRHFYTSEPNYKHLYIFGS